MAVCDRDCFNCPHPDCISDELDSRDWQESQMRDAEARKESSGRRKRPAGVSYYEAHKAEIKTRKAAYWLANRDRLKDEKNARARAWWCKHKDEVNRRRRERRAQKMSAADGRDRTADKG